MSSLFKIETFIKIHHMFSTITEILKENLSFFDLLNYCFPGGSITGTPKIRAMEIIEQLEPNRRSIFYGSIGYISYCGSMDLNIVIRTLMAEKNKIYCSLGGGIVMDSNIESEYQETLEKGASILPILSKLNKKN